MIPSSSGVEQPAVNRRVGGSNPSSGARAYSGAPRDAPPRTRQRPPRRAAFVITSNAPWRREGGGRESQRTIRRPGAASRRAGVVAAEPFDAAPLDTTKLACVAPGVGGISVGKTPMHAAANMGSTTNIAVRMVRGTRMSTLLNGSWSAARLAWRVLRRSLVALRRRLSPGLPLSRRRTKPRNHAVWHHTWVLHSGDEWARPRVSVSMRAASRRHSSPKICLRSFLPEHRSRFERPRPTLRA